MLSVIAAQTASSASAWAPRLGLTMLPGLASCSASVSLPPFISDISVACSSWRGFSSEAEESSKASAATGSSTSDKGKMSQGAGRYGVKLLKSDPAKFERMRTILGYYDAEESSSSSSEQGSSSSSAASSSQQAKAGQPGGPVESVTISLLQTLRYLDLDEGLKRRLLNYRVQQYNRDLEQVHAQTRQLLQQLEQQGGGAPAPKTRVKIPGMPM